jgi:thioredoxin 1
MAGLGVVEVNDGNFDQEVLHSEVPVLVDFWAVWCGPCKAIAPIIDTLAATYAGKVKFVKMNVDQSTSTPMRYRVQAIPTLIFFKDGKPVDQLLGYKPQQEIEERIQRMVGASVSAA